MRKGTDLSGFITHKFDSFSIFFLFLNLESEFYTLSKGLQRLGLLCEQQKAELTQFWPGVILNCHSRCFMETTVLLRIYFPHFQTKTTAANLNRIHSPEEKQ